MSLTAGLTIPCENRAGGLIKVYLANVDDVTSFTFAGGVYTGATMAGGAVFFEFEFEIDTAERRENGVRENGSGKYTHEVEMFLPKLNSTLRDRMQEIMDASACGVIAIVEDSNSLKWVVGYSEGYLKKRPLKLQSDASLSGKTFTDLNGATIILQSDDTTKDVEFTGVVPV
jgi:hypothetical protein